MGSEMCIRDSSLGYRLDLPRAGRFDPEKARALGVPVTQWRLLQRGQAVPLAERMVQPAEVLGSGNDARFAALLTAADKLGIQYIATGHHARVELGSDGVHTVCPAVDAALDESAALAALPQDTLARLLLPLGEFTAADVQEMAQDFKVNGTV